jgi:hypothetical protein
MIVHDLGTLLLEVGEGEYPVGGKKPAAILAALLIGVNRRVPVLMYGPAAGAIAGRGG